MSFKSVTAKDKGIKLLRDKDLYDLRVGKGFSSGHKKHRKGQYHKEFFIKHEKECIHSPQSEKKMVPICYLIGIVKLMYKSKDSLKTLVIRHEQAFHKSRRSND